MRFTMSDNKPPQEAQWAELNKGKRVRGRVEDDVESVDVMKDKQIKQSKYDTGEKQS